MEPGFTTMITGMSGCPMWLRVLHLIPRMATGCSPAKAGPGFPIIHGDGHHFIMEGGSWIPTTERCGCPTMSGDQDGLPGDRRKVFTAGPPSGQG
jgi:hypothetical protein